VWLCQSGQWAVAWGAGQVAGDSLRRSGVIIEVGWPVHAYTSFLVTYLKEANHVEYLLQRMRPTLSGAVLFSTTSCNLDKMKTAMRIT
jgi:hypothetical protein